MDDDLSQMLTGGETLEIEFKDGSINDRELVETVACLANASGGHLLVGVADDGTVTGCPLRHGDRTDPVRVEAMVTNRTEPSVATRASIRRHNDVEVLVVEVPTSRSVVATSDGRYLRRAIDVNGDPQCLPMRPHEVLARAGAVGAQDFSRVSLSGTSMADLETQRTRSSWACSGSHSRVSLMSRSVSWSPMRWYTATTPRLVPPRCRSARPS